MFITELFQTTEPFHTSDSDNTIAAVSDLRKTRLTLSHIKKMREINDVRNVEMKKKLDKVKKQFSHHSAEQGYSPMGQEGMGGDMGGLGF